MKAPVTHNLCPYTRQPLTSLPQVSDEHIFPDAIGGAKDYCIKASAKVNSDLGAKIDAPLVDSFLIGALRLQYGIKSRSGKCQWKLRGKAEGSDQDVDVLFPEQGDVQVKVRKSVEMEVGGTTGRVTLSPEERDAFLAQFIEGHKKKGRTVVLVAESKGKVERIHIPLTIDLTDLRRALCKIAYLAAYEFLGDAFLSDPLIAEWDKAFMQADRSAISNARIHGVAFDTQDQLNLLFPPLQPYEHGAAIVNLQQKGPVVAVTLFGKSFHSIVAMASETSNFGLAEAEGKIAICDAKAGKTRFMSFMDHLVSAASQPPWNLMGR